MTAREIASLWIITVSAVFVIVWDYRSQLNGLVNAAFGTSTLSAPGGVLTIFTGPSTNVGTNAPIPLAGNEFGALATYGTSMSGDVQPGGADTAFGNIFNNLTG